MQDRGGWGDDQSKAEGKILITFSLNVKSRINIKNLRVTTKRRKMKGTTEVGKSNKDNCVLVTERGGNKSSSRVNCRHKETEINAHVSIRQQVFIDKIWWFKFRDSEIGF